MTPAEKPLLSYIGSHMKSGIDKQPMIGPMFVAPLSVSVHGRGGGNDGGGGAGAEPGG